MQKDFVNSTVAESEQTQRRVLSEQKDRRHKTEQELRKLSEVVEQSPNLIILTNPNGIISFVNPRTLELTGFMYEELLGKDIRNFMCIENAGEVYSQLWSDVSQGKVWKGELRNKKKDGSYYWVQSVVSALLGEDGKVTDLIGIHSDITERKEKEIQLQDALEFKRVLLDAVPSPIFYKNFDCVYIGCNEAFENFLGRNREEIIGKTTYDISPTELAITYDDADRKLLKDGGVQTYTAVVKDAHGGRRDVIFHKAVFKDSKGDVAGLIGVILDITDQMTIEHELRMSEKKHRELSNALRETSITDNLTKLYNQRHFYDKINIELDEVARLEALQHPTVILMDVDDFKKVNDVHGHITGDKVLERIGKVLRNSLREADSAYRYGGEEFVIVLPTTTLKQGSVIAEKIRKEIKKQEIKTANDKVVSVTVSIGVAEHQKGETIEAFMHRVDQCMYRAKRSGKNKVSF